MVFCKFTHNFISNSINPTVANMSNICSWYDFARAIAGYAGHTGCDIGPCHSSEFPSKVRRPSFSVLDKTKVKKTFGIRIPHWTESLKACVENLKNSES